MSGKALALKVVNRINKKLKLLHCKNSFLILALRPMLCNTLIQTYFDQMYILSANQIEQKSYNIEFKLFKTSAFFLLTVR